MNSRRPETTEHGFRHHPQCPVKLHISVNAAHGTLDADPQLLREGRDALDRLTQILQLGSVYPFQQ